MNRRVALCADEASCMNPVLLNLEDQDLGRQPWLAVFCNAEQARSEIVADEDDGIFGVFVFIGFKPATAVFEGKVEMERGYIVTDQEMRTNVPGVYAAGDCRVKELRQVVTAAADGAIAAWQAARYVDELE